MRITSIVLASALLLAAAALAGVGRPEAARSAEAPGTESGRSVTATGLGVVRVVPDEARFSFGVRTEGKTAAAALQANEAATGRVLAALREAGIAPADLRTEVVSISPRTDESGAVTGYVAFNAVSARIRALARVGAVVDAAVAAGANEVSGPELSRSDAEAQYRAALRAAYADARAKAQVLAESAGVTLGGMLKTVEGGGGPVPLAEARDAVAGAQVAISPGTQEVTATVVVTFAVG